MCVCVRPIIILNIATLRPREQSPNVRETKSKRLKESNGEHFEEQREEIVVSKHNPTTTTDNDDDNDEHRETENIDPIYNDDNAAS